MNISRNSWHFKVYLQCRKWTEYWINGTPEDCVRVGKVVGLCSYMRTILLWGPLAVLSNLVTFFVIYMVLFYFPFTMDGVAGIFWLWVAGLVIASACFVGIMIRELIHKDDEKTSEDDEKPAGFMSLSKEYLIAMKTKVCPLLNVTEEN